MGRLHWGYLIAGVVLAGIVFVASLLMFPTSGWSVGAVLALAVLVAAGAVEFLMNGRALTIAVLLFYVIALMSGAVLLASYLVPVETDALLGGYYQAAWWVVFVIAYILTVVTAPLADEQREKFRDVTYAFEPEGVHSRAADREAEWPPPSLDDSRDDAAWPQLHGAPAPDPRTVRPRSRLGGEHRVVSHDSGPQQKAEVADVALLDAHAVARLLDVDDDMLVVGNEYTLEAGISLSEPEGFRSVSFTLEMPERVVSIPFLIIVRSDRVCVEDWQQTLVFDVNKTEPQLVTFTLWSEAIGPAKVSIDFYHERHWLQTLVFELRIVERPLEGLLRESEDEHAFSSDPTTTLPTISG